MKNILFLLTILTFLAINFASAQIKMARPSSISANEAVKVQTQLPKTYLNATTNEWTEWATDGILKARCRVLVGTSTKKEFIQLQVISTEEGMCDFTANICNNSAKGANGWQRIKLYKNQPVTINFDKNEACNNGWWWWFKDFKKSHIID
jgi:hypothetical protein